MLHAPYAVSDTVVPFRSVVADMSHSEPARPSPSAKPAVQTRPLFAAHRHRPVPNLARLKSPTAALPVAYEAFDRDHWAMSANCANRTAPVDVIYKYNNEYLRFDAGSGLPDCNSDGRLKGVRIGSALFRAEVATYPRHACIMRGLNGTFIVTPAGVERVKP